MSKEQTKTDIFQYIKATDRVPKQGHAGYLALRIGGEPYRGWYDDGNFYVTVGTPIKIEYVEWAEPYSQLQQENKELKEQRDELLNLLKEANSAICYDNYEKLCDRIKSVTRQGKLD